MEFIHSEGWKNNLYPVEGIDIVHPSGSQRPCPHATLLPTSKRRYHAEQSDAVALAATVTVS